MFDSNMYNPYGQQPAWTRSAPNMPRNVGYGYPQMQNPAGNMQWIRVSGPQGAREVSLQPGAEAWIMDENRPVFYYKSANEMGQCTTKAFRFEEISLDDSGQAADMSQYVTRQEIQMISEKLSKLEKFATEMGGINV